VSFSACDEHEIVPAVCVLSADVFSDAATRPGYESFGMGYQPIRRDLGEDL